MQGAAAIAKRVVVLDHHKTAYEQLQGVELPPNVELHMDMHRSGAMIALDYFTSQGTISKEQVWTRGRQGGGGKESEERQAARKSPWTTVLAQAPSARSRWGPNGV